VVEGDADALLVERVKQGDTRAFEMLVVKYQRRIERLIGRMVRDVDLVQDIAQESFIRAYRALPQFRGDSAFYTWLYRIAVNTAKKALMDMKRDPLVSETSLRSDDDGEETSRAGSELTDGETPEALLASKEVAAAVNAAIEALSEDLRQAITLREIEGLSYEEIAEVMNCPIGTVRSRIFRAREAIATRLRPCSTPARVIVGKAPENPQHPLAAPMKPQPPSLSAPATDEPTAEDLRRCLSALADGEASELAQACRSWREDATARQTWHTYHLIGDVLRSEELAHAPARDEAFLASLRQRLAAEPTVLAPAPVQQANAPRVRQPWLLPAAVAAGFVAVAGVLVVTRTSQPGAPVATPDPGGGVQPGRAAGGHPRCGDGCAGALGWQRHSRSAAGRIPARPSGCA
jgi:RNA polymerase sigma-70 factor (ECF subfamily)